MNKQTTSELEPRDNKPTEEENHVTITLERIKQYQRAGLHEELDAAIGSTVHPDTLRKYLLNPEEAKRAYKISALVDCVRHLPPVRHLEKQRSYRFALKEMRVEPETQIALKRYAGRYNVIHDFANPTKAAIENLEIFVSEHPLTATFVVRYNSPATGQQKGIDGLVVMRGSNIMLAGLSRHGIFFGTVGMVGNPVTTPLIGGAMFEDVEEQDASFSKIALIQKTTSSTEAVLSGPQKIVAGSHNEY